MELFYLMVHCKWVRFSVPIKQHALSRACSLDSAAEGAPLQWLGFRMRVPEEEALPVFIPPTALLFSPSAPQGRSLMVCREGYKDEDLH